MTKGISLECLLSPYTPVHVTVWQVIRDNATSLDSGIFLVLARLANQRALIITYVCEQDSASVTHRHHTQGSLL